MQENSINPIPEVKRKIASFLVSPRLIEQVLNLPEGVRVLHFENDNASNCLKIVIEGEGLPEISSDEMPKNIMPIVTQTSIKKEDGSVKFELHWNWNVGA